MLTDSLNDYLPLATCAPHELSCGPTLGLQLFRDFFLLAPPLPFLYHFLYCIVHCDLESIVGQWKYMYCTYRIVKISLVFLVASSCVLRRWYRNQIWAVKSVQYLQYSQNYYHTDMDTAATVG